MKLEPITWPSSLIKQRLARALQVDWVVPGSPAEEAGIRKGFQVLSIDGGPPNGHGILVSFFVPGDDIVFYDPDAQQCLILQHTRAPLGYNTRLDVNDAFRELVRSGRHFGSDVFQPWLAGDSAVYATLTRDFEAALTPQTHAIFGAFVKAAKKDAAKLEHEDRWSQLGLALCLMEQGEFERADNFLSAYFYELNAGRNSSDMGYVIGLAYFLGARQCQHRGALEQAQDYILEAIELAPQAKPVLDLYEELFGTPFQPNDPVGQGSTFPVAYELHQYDAFDLLPQTDELLRHDDAVSQLKDGEYGLICLLGRYRSNTPFADDCYVLGGLQQDAKMAPAFVHVLTAFNDDPTNEWQQARKQSEMFFLENGLRYQIGYDRKDEIGDTLGLTHLPTWFVIRKGGVVSMSGWLSSHDMLADILAGR